MPGPLLTVTVGESARRGFSAGPLIVLGHGILEGALVVALALGLAAFLAAFVVARGIAVVGGLFLLYLGWGMFKDARAGKISLEFPPVRRDAGGGCALAGSAAAGPAREKTDGLIADNLFRAKEGEKEDILPGRSRGMHPVLAGIFISLSNPYWSLWWATVGLGYITISLKQGSLGLVTFFTGHILSDLVWYSFVAAMIAGGRRFLKPVVYQGTLVICGLFLIGLGGYFIFWGITS